MSERSCRRRKVRHEAKTKRMRALLVAHVTRNKEAKPCAFCDAKTGEIHRYTDAEAYALGWGATL